MATFMKMYIFTNRMFKRRESAKVTTFMIQWITVPTSETENKMYN